MKGNRGGAVMGATMPGGASGNGLFNSTNYKSTNTV